MGKRGMSMIYIGKGRFRYILFLSTYNTIIVWVLCAWSSRLMRNPVISKIRVHFLLYAIEKCSRHIGIEQIRSLLEEFRICGIHRNRWMITKLHRHSLAPSRRSIGPHMRTHMHLQNFIGFDQEHFLSINSVSIGQPKKILITTTTSMIMPTLRFPLVENERLQTLQTNGRSPVCVLMCICNDDVELKFFLHTWHKCLVFTGDNRSSLWETDEAGDWRSCNGGIRKMSSSECSTASGNSAMSESLGDEVGWLTSRSHVICHNVTFQFDSWIIRKKKNLRIGLFVGGSSSLLSEIYGDLVSLGEILSLLLVSESYPFQAIRRRSSDALFE